MTTQLDNTSMSSKCGSEHIIISSFFNVDLKPNYFLAIDIDETIAMYEGISHKWWKEKMVHYLEEFKGQENSYDKADMQCIEEWKEYIKHKLPFHTDEEGLFDIIERAKGHNLHVCIVTARNVSLREITYAHLSHLGITGIDIHFTSGENKAHTIENIINGLDGKYSEHPHVVLIDDHTPNLDDIVEKFGQNSTCYKFVHELNKK